jgi:hypothetical protein
MTEESNETPVGKRVQASLYFLTLYFVVVGVLYLWGYWSTFNVNILEYLSIADVVKLTAYPVASGFLFFAIGAVMGEALFSPGPPRPPMGARTAKVLRKLRPLIIFLYLAVTATFILFANIPNRWTTLSLLLASPIYLIAKRRKFLIGIIPHDSPRSIVIYLLAALPTYAYGQGRLEADRIIEGRKFEYVLSTIDQVTVPGDASPIQHARYIGHTGDFFFFLNPASAELVITKFQDDKALLLKHFDSMSERPTQSGK